MKLEFSRHIFERYSNIEFNKKFLSWEPSCSMRTDRHDAANSRFSLFCERAKKNEPSS